MEPENLSSLIRLSVSDGQKTDSSKVVSLGFNEILYVSSRYEYARSLSII